MYRKSFLFSVVLGLVSFGCGSDEPTPPPAASEPATANPPAAQQAETPTAQPATETTGARNVAPSAQNPTAQNTPSAVPAQPGATPSTTGTSPAETVANTAPGQAPTGQSNFGTVRLSPGFMPDPHVVQGTSGGNIQASTLSPSCAGWVSQTPDHLFEAPANFSTLIVTAASDDDVTLVVQRPDGSYTCNDDSEGLNPLVTMNSAAPGTYKIWVGSYQQSTFSRYRLGFSELSSTTPSRLNR